MIDEDEGAAATFEAFNDLVVTDPPTTSIGIAYVELDRVTPITTQELIDSADAAMYSAKRDGRNTTRIERVEP